MEDIDPLPSACKYSLVTVRFLMLGSYVYSMSAAPSTFFDAEIDMIFPNLRMGLQPSSLHSDAWVKFHYWENLGCRGDSRNQIPAIPWDTRIEVLPQGFSLTLLGRLGHEPEDRNALSSSLFPLLSSQINK